MDPMVWEVLGLTAVYLLVGVLDFMQDQLPTCSACRLQRAMWAHNVNRLPHTCPDAWRWR
jgi:hypothetical protein